MAKLWYRWTRIEQAKTGDEAGDLKLCPCPTAVAVAKGRQRTNDSQGQSDGPGIAAGIA